MDKDSFIPADGDDSFAEDLARLQRQEYDARIVAEELLKRAQRELSRNVIPAEVSSIPAEGVSVPSDHNPTDVTNSSDGKPVPSTKTAFDEPHTTYPQSTDLGNFQHSASKEQGIHHQSNSGIFTSSSYGDEFHPTITNQATSIEVNPVATKRINIAHPQSAIVGDPQAKVQTRHQVKSAKFGETAFVGYVLDHQRTNHIEYQHCLFACFLSQVEPTSVAHALADSDWVEAMQEEMQQFHNQKVWKLVQLPDGKYAIGTKWILKCKRDTRGIVVRNKARLVAQGHRQEEGIDYTEVFAPVARVEAIRLFLAFASFMGFMVYQMDVKSAFLYGEIEEEVYVTQPKSFEDPQHPEKVYKVVKELYGLHQAPRAWYARLSSFLLKHGYRRGTIDKTLFIKKSMQDIILVQVYVDDIIFV